MFSLEWVCDFWIRPARAQRESKYWKPSLPAPGWARRRTRRGFRAWPLTDVGPPANSGSCVGAGLPPLRPGLGGSFFLLKIAVNNSIIHPSARSGALRLADVKCKSYLCYLCDQFKYKCYDEFYNLVSSCVCLCVYFRFLEGYESARLVILIKWLNNLIKPVMTVLIKL